MRNISFVVAAVFMSITLIACGKTEEKLNLTESTTEYTGNNENNELKPEGENNTEEGKEEIEKEEEKKEVKNGVALVTLDEQANAGTDKAYGKKTILIIDGKALAVLQDSDIYYEYNKDTNTVTIDESDWNTITERNDDLEQMTKEVKEDEVLLASNTDKKEEKEPEVKEETDDSRIVKDNMFASADIPNILEVLNGHK